MRKTAVSWSLYVYHKEESAILIQDTASQKQMQLEVE